MDTDHVPHRTAGLSERLWRDTVQYEKLWLTTATRVLLREKMYFGLWAGHEDSIVRGHGSCILTLKCSSHALTLTAHLMLNH